jgi:hypothetical protein
MLGDTFEGTWSLRVHCMIACWSHITITFPIQKGTYSCHIRSDSELTTLTSTGYQTLTRTFSELYLHFQCRRWFFKSVLKVQFTVGVL